MKRKRAAQQGTNQDAARPRLIKADELAAREAANAARAEQRKIAAKAKEPAVVAHKRSPRDAGEARDMFKALFNEAA